MGYHRAGFDVVGVDIAPQPRYPFPFVCMDALEAMRVLLTGGFITDNQGGRNWYLADFVAVHGSPPCQGYSSMRFVTGKSYPKLIASTREALIATGKPYVIENVEGAKSEMGNPFMLCGTMFGLKTIRHRLFECYPPVYFAPASCKHYLKTQKQGRLPHPDNHFITVTGHFPGQEFARRAMGIDWMTRDGLAEAIPPAYTEYIGAHLLQHLAAAQAVPAVRVEAE